MITPTRFLPDGCAGSLSAQGVNRFAALAHCNQPDGFDLLIKQTRSLLNSTKEFEVLLQGLSSDR